jgi:hypothetical protein
MRGKNYDHTQLLLSIHGTMGSVVDAVHQLKDKVASLEKRIAKLEMLVRPERRARPRRKGAA